MTLESVPGIINAQTHSFMHIRGQVARVLLDRAADAAKERPLITHRDIAAVLGVGWDMVHLSLKSLCTEGVIRMERNRLVIKKDLLRQYAA